jgi:aerobic carbon-monoxide dehydrogenase large subunit
VRGDQRGPSMSLSALADAQHGLSAEAEFNSTQMVYPYGAHVVQLAIDGETGGVTIERYLVAFDIGRAVNPMLVEGQMQGGMAQGLGGALYEEFVYGEDGQPLSVTFADYLMPTAREVPEMEIILSEDAPSPLNPLGVKGAGESGITPVGAAIASAIDDALQTPGAVRQLPITPQRLRALIAAS